MGPGDLLCDCPDKIMQCLSEPANIRRPDSVCIVYGAVGREGERKEGGMK
jgi:hypothetical protein